MSWILRDGKPVRVRWQGPTLTYVDDDMAVIADDVEIFDTRRRAREARPRPVSVDDQIAKIADYLGVGADLDAVFERIRSLVFEHESMTSDIKVMASALGEIPNPATVREAVKILDREHRRAIERLDECQAALAVSNHIATTAQNDCRRLRTALKIARTEIWALELKAEALHCHQVMLAAERARLRKELGHE